MCFTVGQKVTKCLATFLKKIKPLPHNQSFYHPTSNKQLLFFCYSMNCVFGLPFLILNGRSENKHIIIYSLAKLMTIIQITNTRYKRIITSLIELLLTELLNHFTFMKLNLTSLEWPSLVTLNPVNPNICSGQVGRSQITFSDR